jgi:hypothetical protein
MPPLDPGQFRLMKLHPGDSSAPLVCRLVHVPLDESPRYEALSYTWGHSSERFTLYQESEDSNDSDAPKSVFHITKGLYEALVQLRKVSESRVLWVDAVCIDQGNLKERGEQVKIMRQIYTRAERVLVWLGPEDNETPVALKAITILKDYVTSRGLSFETLKSLDDEDPFAEMLGLTEHVLDAEPLTILRQIYRRPWFQRIWVVQEVTAGASNCEVHIGPHAVPWDDLGMATLWLEALRWQSPMPFKVPGQRNALVMWQGRLLARDTSPPLLDEARRFLASDPRDMVFAMYGFSAFQQLFKMFGFTPDYTISMLELYKSVTLLAIKSSQTLEVLHYVDHPELTDEDPGWPSWVPRWNKPTPYCSFPLQDYALYRRKAQGVLSLLEEQQGDILRLKGVILGYSTQVAQHIDWTSTETETTIQNPTALTQFWDASSQHQDLLSHSKDDSFAGLAQALTAGLDFDYNSTAKGFTRHTADAIDFLLHSFTVTSPSNSNQPSSALHNHLLSLQQIHPHGDRLRYQKDLVWICTNRHLFYTDGGLFGLGPLAIQPGDITVMLYGGHTPFMLRPSGGYYQLLGECYLQNAMDWDASDLCTRGSGKGELTETIFELI